MITTEWVCRAVGTMGAIASPPPNFGRIRSITCSIKRSPPRFLYLPTALGWLDDQSVQVSVKNEEKLDLKFLFCVFAMRQIEGLIPGCPGVKIVIFVHEPN